MKASSQKKRLHQRGVHKTTIAMKVTLYKTYNEHDRIIQRSLGEIVRNGLAREHIQITTINVGPTIELITPHVRRHVFRAKYNGALANCLTRGYAS